MNAKHKFQLRALQWMLPLMALIMIAFATWEYFSSKNLSVKGQLSPFSEGLFKNEIAGRIGNIKIEHGTAIIFLHYNGFKNNREIVFYPYDYDDENGNRIDFFKTTQPGDSLWKFTNSNVIYTIGKDNVQRQWHFATSDKYGRKYAK